LLYERSSKGRLTNGNGNLTVTGEAIVRERKIKEVGKKKREGNTKKRLEEKSTANVLSVTQIIKKLLQIA
jgi:hypothetical protein